MPQNSMSYYLSIVLQRFCNRERLVYCSADELLLHELTPQQREWVEAFIKVWDGTNDD